MENRFQGTSPDGTFPVTFTWVGDGKASDVTLAVPLLDAVAFDEEKFPAATGDGVIFRRKAERQTGDGCS